MRKLYFVRHGLSVGNINQVFADKNSPLAPEGLGQAIKTAQALKSSGMKFDLIITSPMHRARHTAEIIADHLDYPMHAIEISSLFVERNFGELTGSSTQDFYKRFPAAAIDDVKGAEILEELQARAQRALVYVQAKDNTNILVVSHGAFGRAMRRVLDGRPYTDEYRESSYIDNGEVLELI